MLIFLFSLISLYFLRLIKIRFDIPLLGCRWRLRGINFVLLLLRIWYRNIILKRGHRILPIWQRRDEFWLSWSYFLTILRIWYSAFNDKLLIIVLVKYILTFLILILFYLLLRYFCETVYRLSRIKKFNFVLISIHTHLTTF